jgi:hypothetical protein
LEYIQQRKVIALRVAESSVEGADVPIQVADLVKDLFRCEVGFSKPPRVSHTAEYSREIDGG